MYADVKFSVLGPVRLHRQGVVKAVGQPKQCAVLASLLLREGRPVSLPELVEDVWGDQAPPSAAGSVRTYIYRLRQVLGKQGDSSVRLVDGGYSLYFQPDALDLTRFKETMARAREARSSGNLTLAADLLSESLTLWRGQALAGVPGPFASRQRSFLSQLRITCVEERLSCEVERGRYAEAAAELSALHVEHPLRERVSELLMTALYGAGRQSEALTVYHTTGHLLHQHLGVNPSPELQQVHERILSGRFQVPRRDARPAFGQAFAASQPLAQLPAAVPGLVGREKEQEQVKQFVTDAAASSARAVCLVNGVVGVGKTAFTITAAHRLAERFPDGQLFADMHDRGPAGEPKGPAEVLTDFLRSLGVRSDAIPETTQARGLLFRDLLAKRRMLIVLDNAWDTDELQYLLPVESGSMALIASRMQLHSLAASYQTLSLILRPLSQANAYRFLARRLGSERAAAEPEAIDRIIESAGGLPLALANVAARAAYRPQTRLAHLADEYSPSEHRALDALRGDEDVLLDKHTSYPEVVSGRYNWGRPIAAFSAEQPGSGRVVTTKSALKT